MPRPKPKPRALRKGDRVRVVGKHPAFGKTGFYETPIPRERLWESGGQSNLHRVRLENGMSVRVPRHELRAFPRPTPRRKAVRTRR